jgi:hypothetical protein
MCITLLDITILIFTAENMSTLIYVTIPRAMTASVVQWSEFLTAYPEVLGSIPWRYQIFCIVVGLEWGPLSLVRINEELLEKEVAALV